MGSAPALEGVTLHLWSARVGFWRDKELRLGSSPLLNHTKSRMTLVSGKRARGGKFWAIESAPDTAQVLN